MNNITRAKFLGQKSTGGGSSNDKGWFATQLALTTAYPVGQNGWFAVVGDTDTVWIWDSDTSAWVDSGVTPLSDYDWTKLATKRSAEPTLYDTQATYKVYEYTYGTTLYYRRVYDTYDPATDTFYTTSALTTAICSRALSI